MAQNKAVTTAQIEVQIGSVVDPILEALEALADSQATTSEKMSSALAAADHLEARVAGAELQVQALEPLLTQHAELEKRLQQLAQTTVGTAEYEAAQRAVAETLNSLVEITAGLVPSMKTIQATLSDLATMYKATLELSKSPVRLSDDAASAISRSLSAQLEKSMRLAISGVVRAEVQQGYAQVQEGIDEAVSRHVDRVEAANKALSARVDRASAQVERYEALVDRIERRSALALRLAVWVAVVAAVAVGAVVVVGVSAQGVLGLLGIDAGMSALWARVWGAPAWYIGVGWGVLAVALSAGLVVGLGRAVTRLWAGLEKLVERRT